MQCLCGQEMEAETRCSPADVIAHTRCARIVRNELDLARGALLQLAAQVHSDDCPGECSALPCVCAKLWSAETKASSLQDPLIAIQPQARPLVPGTNPFALLAMAADIDVLADGVLADYHLPVLDQ